MTGPEPEASGTKQRSRTLAAGPGRGRWRPAYLAGIILLLASMVAAFGPGALAARADTVVGAPQDVAGTGELDAVACPTAATCMAVGWEGGGNIPLEGVAVPITNGTPGTVQDIAGTNSLYGVGCPSATSCMAVGLDNSSQGVAVPIINGTPGTVQDVPGTEELFGVACANATTCEAGGENSTEGVAVAITNGTPGTVQDVPGTAYLNGVACPSTTTCETVGDGTSGGGVVVPVINGTPASPQDVAGTADLNGVSCASATSCEAAGDTGTTSLEGLVVSLTITKPSADLSVTISGPSAAADGSSFTETITVDNHGPSTATDIVTGVAIPQGLTVTADPGGSQIGRVVYWKDPSLAAGATVIYTVTLQVGSHVHATVVIAAATGSLHVRDPHLANNVAATTVKLG